MKRRQKALVGGEPYTNNVSFSAAVDAVAKAARKREQRKSHPSYQKNLAAFIEGRVNPKPVEPKAVVAPRLASFSIQQDKK